MLSLVDAIFDRLEVGPKIARFHRRLFSGRLSVMEMAQDERRRDSDTSGGEKPSKPVRNARPIPTEPDR